MVPAPPEFSQVRGSSYLTKCEAHIWCWPTPAAKIVLFGASAPIRSMTCWGERLPSAGRS